MWRWPVWGVRFDLFWQQCSETSITILDKSTLIKLLTQPYSLSMKTVTLEVVQSYTISDSHTEHLTATGDIWQTKTTSDKHIIYLAWSITDRGYLNVNHDIWQPNKTSGSKHDIWQSDESCKTIDCHTRLMNGIRYIWQSYRQQDYRRTWIEGSYIRQRS